MNSRSGAAVGYSFVDSTEHALTGITTYHFQRTEARTLRPLDPLLKRSVLGTLIGHSFPQIRNFDFTFFTDNQDSGGIFDSIFFSYFHLQESSEVRASGFLTGNRDTNSLTCCS